MRGKNGWISRWCFQSPCALDAGIGGMPLAWKACLQYTTWQHGLDLTYAAAYRIFVSNSVCVHTPISVGRADRPARKNGSYNQPHLPRPRKGDRLSSVSPGRSDATFGSRLLSFLITLNIHFISSYHGCFSVTNRSVVRSLPIFVGYTLV
jgi:hypothetical protein